MVLAAALSMSLSSHHSYEAALEGAILQQTASVDYYLQTAAPKWTPNACLARECVPRQELQALFARDLQASIWQYAPSAHGQSEISCYDSEPVVVHSSLLPALPSLSAQQQVFAPPMLQPPAARRRRQQPVHQEADGRSCHLEKFLQEDVHRLMQLQEQLLHDTAASDAAVLSTTDAERQRRMSSGSLANSNSSISFVRLPDHSLQEQQEEDTGEDAGQHNAVAAVLAAATAIAAVDSLVGSPHSPSAALRSSASSSSMAAAAGSSAEGLPSTASPTAALLPAVQQQEQPAAAGGAAQAQALAPPAAAVAAAFKMEADEDIAAQKAAARTRFAELQQQGAAGTASTTTTAAAGAVADNSGDSGAEMAEATCSTVPGKVAGKGQAAEAVDGWAALAGGMHSGVVPQRPRGLAAKMHQPPRHGFASGPMYSPRAALGQLVDRLLGVDPGIAGAGGGSSVHEVLRQHEGFFQGLRAGLLLCVVLLPVLWALQPGAGTSRTLSGGLVRSMLPRAVAAKAGQLFGVMYITAAAAGLLYCVLRSLLHQQQQPLLQFTQPELERHYLTWSNSGKVVTDCLFQLMSLLASCCLWQRLQQQQADSMYGEPAAAAGAVQVLLSAVSMLGSGVPLITLMLVRSSRYVQWREQLLVGSRLALLLALSAMQLVMPGAAGGGWQQLQVSMPLVTLASVACMQVRLAVFVPYQAAQLLVLLLRMQGANPLLHLAQLLGGGLCLPCLLLHRMELHSRRAFLAALSGPAPSPLTAKAV